jgi:hypothetical protein
MGKRNSNGAGVCMRNEEQNDPDVDEREMAEQVNRQDISVRKRAYCIEKCVREWIYAGGV